MNCTEKLCGFGEIGGNLELLEEIGCKQCDRLYQAGRVESGGKGGEKRWRDGNGGWLCSMMLKNFSEIKKWQNFSKNAMVVALVYRGFMRE